MANVVLAEAWSKKAQVPAQIVARFKGVVGVVDTVNALVAALGSALTAVTVVLAANTPVTAPDATAIMVCGVVTVGMLGAGLEGR